MQIERFAQILANSKKRRVGLCGCGGPIFVIQKLLRAFSATIDPAPVCLGFGVRINKSGQADSERQIRFTGMFFLARWRFVTVKDDGTLGTWRWGPRWSSRFTKGL